MVNSIETSVLALISAQCGVATGKITGDGNRWSLGFDSLDDIELLMALEHQFDIEIPDSHAERLKDVRDVINYVTLAVRMK